MENRLATPFFEVARAPMYAVLNGQNIKSDTEALINPSGEIIGQVSKRYRVVSNDEVANVFEEALEGIQVLSLRDHMNHNGSSWKREIVLDNDEYSWMVNGQDECKMKLEIFNSYNGKMSVGFRVSGWRKVCSNGMFGWSHILTARLSHFSDGIVDSIRNSFNNKIGLFGEKIKIFEEWDEQTFTKKDYEDFIESRDYLSDKMKEKYKGYYDPIMNKYGGNRETKWESYNVLTAIAQHYTRARQGSNVFSASYKRTEKLALELGEWTPIREKSIAIAMG